MSTFINLRFITEEDLISDAIRLVTHAPRRGPSHVEFGLENDTFYLGAHSSGGVQIRPANYCKPSWERRYALPCTDAEYAAVMSFAKAQIGKPYDFADIAGILLDTDWHTRDKWICSEMVIASLEQAPIFMLNVLAGLSYRIDPDKLHLSPRLIGNCYYSYAA